jgi:kynureninase
MQLNLSAECAKALDATDKLSLFRNKFHIPKHNNSDVAYFCGNSLGLQPKITAQYIMQDLFDWQNYGVEGHFLAKNPWVSYHEILTDKAAKIVGAKPIEVVMMNQLTSNLHFLMVSFYRPTKKKYKILTEAKAFPSDQYAVESQVKFHGFDPQDAIIEIQPDEGTNYISNKKIIDAIISNKDELALVFIGGVNYYTGQVFDMKTIAECCNKNNITIGFDLAHAAGNVKLNLHDWDVDFAAWCTYKYLNSGPGSVGGVFVHEKHATNFDLPRLTGWWGHDKSSRFKMDKTFIPMEGAEGWQLSNAPVLSMAAHNAALDVFTEAGIDNLIEKSKAMHNYLRFLIADVIVERNLEIITPEKKEEHGCQLSIFAKSNGKKLFDYLTEHGVVTDWREPDVIRMAPVPLYNSFYDIWRLYEVLKDYKG